MKKILLFISLATVAILSSCSGDPVEVEKDYIKVNGEEYSLSYGSMKGYTPNLTASPKYREYKIVLNSNSTGVNPQNSIIFYVYSANTTSIADGDYTYTSTGSGAMMFDYPEVKVGMQYEGSMAVDGTILPRYDIDETKTNKVTVSSEGEDKIYDINLHFTQNGKEYEVEAHYKGGLELVQ